MQIHRSCFYTILWSLIFNFFEKLDCVRVSNDAVDTVGSKQVYIDDGYPQSFQSQYGDRPFVYQTAKGTNLQPPNSYGNAGANFQSSNNYGSAGTNFQSSNSYGSAGPNFQPSNSYGSANIDSQDDNPAFRQNGGNVPYPLSTSRLPLQPKANHVTADSSSANSSGSNDDDSSGNESEESQLIKEIHREALQANADMETLSKTLTDQDKNDTMIDFLKRPNFDFKVRVQNKTVMKVQMGNSTDIKDFVDELQVEKGVRRQLLEHLIKAKVDAKLTAKALEAMVEHFKVSSQELQSWKLPEGVNRAILKARIHILPKEKQLALAERISDITTDNKKKTEIERQRAEAIKHIYEPSQRKSLRRSKAKKFIWPTVSKSNSRTFRPMLRIS